MRNVQGDFQQQPHQQTVQSSPSSTAGASPASGSSQVHGGQQQGQQVTQFRVARIHEFSPCQDASDVQNMMKLCLTCAALSATAVDREDQCVCPGSSLVMALTI